MVWSIQQATEAASSVWGLASAQHGVVARWQLVALGLSRRAIEHRIAKGRLHPVRAGVYAVGRPGLSRHGVWMAAVLSCGRTAVLSHRSAAALWGMVRMAEDSIEITARRSSCLQQPGIRVHRRPALPEDDIAVRDNIPTTGVVRTLLDLAADLPSGRLERAINEADRLDLVAPGELRAALGAYRGQRGVARLRQMLDRHTFRLTDSELERFFLLLVDEVGLPRPSTQQRINGFKVDFYWPALGLVVETDGLRYHRTPAQQARDRLRDQAHTAAGLTPLHFTHAQVRYEPAYVRTTLAVVARRLSRAPDA